MLTYSVKRLNPKIKNKNNTGHVRFEVSTAVTMMIIIFWEMTMIIINTGHPLVTANDNDLSHNRDSSFSIVTGYEQTYWSSIHRRGLDFSSSERLWGPPIQCVPQAPSPDINAKLTIYLRTV
jgi:hypothetical protein